MKIQTQGSSVQKQAATTITYLHSWSKIQAEIRARRICMVTEDRIRRKIIHSQLKLEAKIHDLEVTCKANRFSVMVFWTFSFQTDASLLITLSTTMIMCGFIGFSVLNMHLCHYFKFLCLSRWLVNAYNYWNGVMGWVSHMSQLHFWGLISYSLAFRHWRHAQKSK